MSIEFDDSVLYYIQIKIIFDGEVSYQNVCSFSGKLENIADEMRSILYDYKKENPGSEFRLVRTTITKTIVSLM